MKCLICNTCGEVRLVNHMLLCEGHAEDYNVNKLSFVTRHQQKIEGAGYEITASIKIRPAEAEAATS
jgi:hypothetical protein